MKLRQADLRQAEAQNANALANLERYRLLVVKDEISKQLFDAVSTTAESETAAVQAASAASQAARKELEQRQAQLQQARTRLDEAQSNAPGSSPCDARTWPRGWPMRRRRKHSSTAPTESFVYEDCGAGERRGDQQNGAGGRAR